MTLKIESTTTKTKKGERATKSARLHRRTIQRRPRLTLSSSTIGASMRTDAEEISRATLTTSSSFNTTTTTAEAERVRSETTTRAARGSFMD